MYKVDINALSFNLKINFSELFNEEHFEKISSLMFSPDNPFELFCNVVKLDKTALHAYCVNHRTYQQIYVEVYPHGIVAKSRDYKTITQFAEQVRQFIDNKADITLS